MKTSIAESGLLLLRRIIGTNHCAVSADAHSLKAHRRHIDALNASVIGCSPTAEVRSSALFRRARSVVSALAPNDLADVGYVRVGRQYDGGYVMVNRFPESLKAAYSFGVSNDVSWDEQIADRGIPVFLYDHTVGALPKMHPRFHFKQTGLCGFKGGARLQTLSRCLAENGHGTEGDFLLKVDIEGCEWDVFREVSERLLNQFQQIVVEFHGLTQLAYEGSRFSVAIEVLEKLNVTHQVVHVHANCAGNVLAFGALVLPDMLEVTYVRRADFPGRLRPISRVFPTELDQPTFAGFPDIYLGCFSGAEVGPGLASQGAQPDLCS